MFSTTARWTTPWCIYQLGNPWTCLRFRTFPKTTISGSTSLMTAKTQCCHSDKIIPMVTSMSTSPCKLRVVSQIRLYLLNSKTKQNWKISTQIRTMVHHRIQRPKTTYIKRKWCWRIRTSSAIVTIQSEVWARWTMWICSKIEVMITHPKVPSKAVALLNQARRCHRIIWNRRICFRSIVA